MKHNSFEIKISDLLNEPGKEDVIEFEEVFSQELPNLSKKGIKGSIFFQSLNSTSLLARLENMECELDDICDKCLSNFTRQVKVKEFEAKFVLPSEETQEEEIQTEDDFFPIDQKSETINIEPMIIQCIKLEEPITKKCPVCASIKDDSEDEEEDDQEYFESNSNVVFTKQ